MEKTPLTDDVLIPDLIQGLAILGADQGVVAQIAVRALVDLLTSKGVFSGEEWNAEYKAGLQGVYSGLQTERMRKIIGGK